MEQKLKLFREQRGLTQNDIARQLNVSRQTVSNWETGKVPIDLENALRLCNFYGITINDLLDTDSKENALEYITKAEPSTDNNMDLDSYLLNTNTISALEIFGLAVILLLTCEFPFLGSIVSISILILMKKTKRNYILIYILCCISLLINLFHIHIFIDHCIIDTGTSIIEKVSFLLCE